MAILGYFHSVFFLLTLFLLLISKLMFAGNAVFFFVYFNLQDQIPAGQEQSLVAAVTSVYLRQSIFTLMVTLVTVCPE